MRLYAMVYGAEAPVASIQEYGEHEVKIGDGPWERIRYALCNLEFGGIQVQMDLRDLRVATDEMSSEERVRNLLGEPDADGFFRNWHLL